MKTYKSKLCDGLEYITHPASGGSVIEVKYKGKQVLVSPRKQHIKEALVMLETSVPQYGDLMEQALAGQPYDKDRSSELRTKLYDIFEACKRVS